MGSIRKTNTGKEKHWFIGSLKLLVKSLPKIKRQYKSIPDQLSLPGMEGEAERTMKKERKK